jgi:hypothetical protein
MEACIFGSYDLSPFLLMPMERRDTVSQLSGYHPEVVIELVEDWSSQIIGQEGTDFMFVEANTRFSGEEVHRWVIPE